MVKIGVIIPVVNVPMAEELLLCLSMGYVQPDYVYLVNNSGQEINVPLDFDRWGSPVGIETPAPVNASWNYGLNYYQKIRPVDLVAILNDDLLVGRDFLGRIADAYANNHWEHKPGCFCPQTVKSKHNVGRGSTENPILPMHRREGWAMTLDADLLYQIPPIPSSLKTFCGDDWFWHHCYKLGRPWVKMVNNWIFHYGSTSVTKLGKQKDLKPEKEIFARCLSSM